MVSNRNFLFQGSIFRDYVKGIRQIAPKVENSFLFRPEICEETRHAAPWNPRIYSVEVVQVFVYPRCSLGLEYVHTVAKNLVQT